MSKPYRETGSFTHDGKVYNLSKALKQADKVPVKRYAISKLEWVLAHDKPDPQRVAAADLKAPVLLALDRQGRVTVIDGLHRLAKAVEQGAETLPGRLLTKVKLKRARQRPT